MEFNIHYSVCGSLHVEASSPEVAESIMRANMVDDIIGGIDVDTLNVYGIEVENYRTHDPHVDQMERYIRRAV